MPAARDENPYASPVAPPKPPALEHPPVPGRTPRFRWRIIPAFLLLLVSFSAVVNGVFWTSAIAYEAVTQGPRTDVLILVALTSSAVVTGGIAFFTARAWWKGQWRSAVIGTGIVFAIWVAGSLVGRQMGL
jgi:hypothetical protein